MTDQPEDTASLVARLVHEIDADRITSDEATALQTALFARMGRSTSRMLAAAFAHHAGRTDIAAALLTRSPDSMPEDTDTHHSFEVTKDLDRADLVAWSCGTCNWAGLGLPSEDAARREHRSIAADIAAGRLEPAEFTPRVVGARKGAEADGERWDGEHDPAAEDAARETYGAPVSPDGTLL